MVLIAFTHGDGPTIVSHEHDDRMKRCFYPECLLPEELSDTIIAHKLFVKCSQRGQSLWATNAGFTM